MIYFLNTSINMMLAENFVNFDTALFIWRGTNIEVMEKLFLT